MSFNIFIARTQGLTITISKKGSFPKHEVKVKNKPNVSVKYKFDINSIMNNQRYLS